MAWLVNYLCNLPTCTSMVVSHDSKFLDDVCTDVIHYESFKLKKYRCVGSEACGRRGYIRSFLRAV